MRMVNFLENQDIVSYIVLLARKEWIVEAVKRLSVRRGNTAFRMIRQQQ